LVQNTQQDLQRVVFSHKITLPNPVTRNASAAASKEKARKGSNRSHPPLAEVLFVQVAYFCISKSNKNIIVITSHLSPIHMGFPNETKIRGAPKNKSFKYREWWYGG